MEYPEPLVQLTEPELAAVWRAPMAILVLMRPLSPRCARYHAEIEPLLANGELGGIQIGELVVEDSERRARLINAIIGKEVPALPATVIYWEGREVEFLLTTRASSLTRHIARVIASALMISSLEGSAGGVKYGRDRTSD